MPQSFRRKQFTSRTSWGLLHHQGYGCGAFGIASDGPQRWTIYHLPTGMTFLYSEWGSLRAAKAFVAELLTRADWEDPQMDRHPEAFHAACRAAAIALGIPPRPAVRNVI